MNKKIIVLLACFAIILSQACATTVVRPNNGGVVVDTMDPKVARDAASPNSNYATPLENACAELVRQGKASYIQTPEGTRCIVHNGKPAPGETPSPLGKTQKGAFENIGSHTIMIEVYDEIGIKISSFTLFPKGNKDGKDVRVMDLVPGKYHYTARYTSSNKSAGFDLPIDTQPCPDCHVSNGTTVEWREVVR
ncbi:MAG: hypothetical protein NTZ49_01335 [Candidatus Parcubacteria bacterium]|nr:hypothetical protein [Candidatus Parcubacteria bacterium]